MNYQQQAEEIAARILAMPPKQQREVIALITDAAHRQDAIERGDWSHFALQLALREKHKLPIA